MTYKLVAFLLLILPFSFSCFLYVNDLEFLWYFSENYKIYDFIISLVKFSSVSVGIYLCFPKNKELLLFTFLLLFIIYQSFSYAFSGKRHVGLLELNDSVILALVSYHGGAFTMTGYVDLKVSKPYGAFRKQVTIDRFDRIIKGKMSIRNTDTLRLEMLNYSLETITEEVDIKNINRSSY